MSVRDQCEVSSKSRVERGPLGVRDIPCKRLLEFCCVQEEPIMRTNSGDK